MKKVAIIVFDGHKWNGGTMGSGLRVKHVLNYLGQQATNLLVNTKDDKVPRAKQSKFDKAVKRSQIKQELSKYDFLYIVSVELIADREFIFKTLMELKIPYSILCHDENDFGLVKEYQRYLTNDLCKFVQYIEPYSINERHRMIAKPNCPEIFVPCQLDPFEKFDDSIDLESKTNDIIYGGRVASRKKILYLVQMAPYLHRDIEIWGSRNPGPHNIKLEHKIVGFFEHYKGEYKFNDHPSKKSWYHWSCVMLGRGKKYYFNPRIERSTVEAFLTYSLPIMFYESIPETFDQNYPLLIYWAGEEGIGRLGNEYPMKTKLLEDKLNITDNYTIEEKVKLIKDTYNKLFDDTHYYENYMKIINLINKNYQETSH